MRIDMTLLKQAAAAGVLHEPQPQALWSFLAQHQPDTPSFKPAHVLYYLGGLTAIAAMTLFVTLAWDRLPPGALFAITAAYAAAAAEVAEHLLEKRRLPLPAGIVGALAVALVPLAVYGLQRWLGWWPEGRGDAYRDYHRLIDWRWLMMELATLAAGAAALWRWRQPFGVLPVAVTLWYLSMDIVPLLLGGHPGAFFSDEGKRVSCAFGLCMLIVALWVDLRSTRRDGDFAFWLYCFGTMAFWGALTSMHTTSELGRFAYACVNLLMIATGALLARRVFAVFGAIGFAFYLGHLSATVFKDSLLFPLALAAIGLGVVAAGVAWQRHEARFGARLRGWLPAGFRERIEHREAA